MNTHSAHIAIWLQNSQGISLSASGDHKYTLDVDECLFNRFALYI